MSVYQTEHFHKIRSISATATFSFHSHSLAELLLLMPADLDLFSHAKLLVSLLWKVLC